MNNGTCTCDYSNLIEEMYEKRKKEGVTREIKRTHIHYQMKNNTLIISIVFFFILNDAVNCLGQVRFPLTPLKRIEGDSIFYELNHSCYYSYFSQKYDSVFISFNRVIFHQLAVINNRTKQGYFVVTYKGKILFYYEIHENRIEGIGLMYYPDLFGEIHKTPFCQSMFKNGKLDGITTFYDEFGIISSIILYKKGKYKYYLYNREAKSRKMLENGNKYAKDPFKLL